jgi:hypothetical protein
MSQKYDWEAAADKSVPVHTSVSRSGSKKKEVERPEGHEV